MKEMKVSEIRELTTQEIEERLQTTKDELANQKLVHAISPLQNPMRLRADRRDIARMKTVLRERATETKEKK